MTQQTLDTNESGSYVGDGGTSNNAKANDNFTELYAANAASKRHEIVVPLVAGANTYAHFFPRSAATVTAYKYVQGDNFGDNDTLTIQRVTRATGVSEATLASAVNLGPPGTPSQERSFTPDDAALPHALTAAQGLRFTFATGASETLRQLTLIIDYTE